MRFLIYGAGFIGVGLAERLSARGHSVLLAKRAGTRPRPLIAEALRDLPYMRYGDPAEPLRAYRPDVAVNAVGAIGGGELWAANAEFPRRLCKAAEEAGWRGKLVHISAVAVAGPSGVEEELHLSGVRPAGAFAESKVEGERAVAACGRWDWAIVRPGAVYGPYNDHDEWSLLARLAELGLAPGLDLRLPAISITDLSTIVELAASSASRDFLFAVECEPLPFDAVVEALEEAAGRRLRRIPAPLGLASLLAPGPVRGLLGLAKLSFSCEKAKRLLGIAPRYKRSDMVEMFKVLLKSASGAQRPASA